MHAVLAFFFFLSKAFGPQVCILRGSSVGIYRLCGAKKFLKEF